jgi:hypothetical protein
MSTKTAKVARSCGISRPSRCARTASESLPATSHRVAPYSVLRRRFPPDQPRSTAAVHRPSALCKIEPSPVAAAASCHRCSFYIADRSDSAQSVDFREAGTQARPAPRGHPAARADVYGLEEPGLQEFVQLGAAYARARAASVAGEGSVRSSGHLFGSVCLAVVAGGQPTVVSTRCSWRTARVWC